uniref:IMP dehydrogenase/GMP reductase, related n=1 Tax=Medicago truncatula TaxID=3880 RepID=A2Q510_MEDTR|nr:IMP dehydrogenase/GMP reductase, related [Medicago truncatula]
MARDEDEWQRVIREDRMRNGKTASTASAQKEKVDQNPYVPKTRKRMDARPGVESSQPHMDHSSQVVDPTQTYEYAKGFRGYDRMEEDIMFYQLQDEAEDEEVACDEEVPEDVVADYIEAENVVPEGEPEPEPQTQQRRRRVPPISPYPVGEPPYPGGPETTPLLSHYVRHVTNPLWMNYHNMWHDQTGYKCINAGKKMKELGKPETGLRWFWELVEGSSLHDLIYTGYSTVTHAMIRAMCER